jgi:LacI family transcriptional regulator
VINERPDVAPETRQRVQEVIDRLGYRPNAIARSLINQRSHTLGVVTLAGEFYGPARTLVGIEQQIRAEGYSLLLDLLHHPETVNVSRILNRLLSHQVDGIIWAVPEIESNRSWLQDLAPHLGVPVIFLSMGARPNLNVAAIDNRSGARLATEHLLEQGYRKIGLITGPLAWWEARQRKLGWQDALQAAGLPVEGRQVVEGDWSAESGAEGITRLFEGYPEVEAVFACNDQMALGVLQSAQRLGRKAPEHLGVVGFDNTPESGYYWPPLTTIRNPLIQLGCAAVSELISRIQPAASQDADAGPITVLLEPELIVRESSIRPGAAAGVHGTQRLYDNS